ncbi:unnamed protein product [Lampetra planeri]
MPFYPVSCHQESRAGRREDVRCAALTAKRKSSFLSEPHPSPSRCDDAPLRSDKRQQPFSAGTTSVCCLTNNVTFFRSAQLVSGEKEAPPDVDESVKFKAADG